MRLFKRIEAIWNQDRSYAIRYFVVLSGGGFLHILLAAMFAISGNWGCAGINIFSILVYALWVNAFSKRSVNSLMLLILYLDMIAHSCVYNVLFGMAPGFYMYAFISIPVCLVLCSQDMGGKNPLATATVLCTAGIILMLATLSKPPIRSLPGDLWDSNFFQANILVSSLLMGTFCWEALAQVHLHRQELPRQVEYDQLTGLYNRATLMRDTATVHGTQYCVIMCDIDNFKQFNDQHGLSAGDAMLVTIGKVLKTSLRREDMVCRWAGERFLLVIQSDLDTARTAVERIRRKINATVITVGNDAASVNMTYGIGDCMEEDSFEKVVAIAEENMRRGKQMGKNCVVATGDQPDTVRKDSIENSLDTTNLSSTVFSALSVTSDSTYIYLCNLNTNVSRWSISAVDYFGLPGEYMYDAENIWLGYVHPDDRDIYIQDLHQVLSGKKRFHDITYRARNKNGDYVLCACKGVVTEGDDSIPSFFTGTITNMGIAPADTTGR